MIESFLDFIKKIISILKLICTNDLELFWFMNQIICIDCSLIE